MPSSTSSSSARQPRWPWLKTWVPALLLAAVALLGRELYWRGRGFVPIVRDDTDLWCQMRDAASSGDRRTIALVGASRMRRGVSPQVLAAECPGYRVVQLAVGGSSPVAILQDLAADERFRGIVVCSLSAQFVIEDHRGLQASYLHYYRHDWNLSKRLDRAMRTAVQSTFVIAQLDLSWRVLLRKVLDGERTYAPALRQYADRFSVFDFRRPGGDPQALEGARQFALDWFPDRIQRARRSATREQWLERVGLIDAAVRRIQARGGKVLFVRPPSSGPVRRVEEDNYPRKDYWDVFAASITAPTVHFEDVPVLRALECPEWAHLNEAGTTQFTTAIAAQLHRLGMVVSPAARGAP